MQSLNTFSTTTSLSKEHIPLFVLTCWSIWNSRNDFVWEGIVRTPATTSYLARKLLVESRTVRGLRIQHQQRMSSPSPNCWVPPSPGEFKMNIDGAVFKEVPSIGVGAVIRDENGEVLAAMSSKIPGTHEPFMVEAIAVLHALKVLKTLFIYQVVVETDCINLVQAIQAVPNT